METSSSKDPRMAVLIVEDDKEAIEVLQIMIARKFPDVAICVADNGESALRLCREHLPDIVVTDINMPGIDGIRMAEEIKLLNPEAKIIMMTGYSDEIYQERLMKIGVADCLIKPVDLRKLFGSIGSYIEQVQQEQSRSVVPG